MADEIGWLALCSRREGIVPVRESLRAPQTIGIVPQVDVEREGRRMPPLVEGPDLSATVGIGVAGPAGVAVVEEYPVLSRNAGTAIRNYSPGQCTGLVIDLRIPKYV